VILPEHAAFSSERLAIERGRLGVATLILEQRGEVIRRGERLREVFAQDAALAVQGLSNGSQIPPTVTRCGDVDYFAASLPQRDWAPS
jgi:hypothetical protein